MKVLHKKISFTLALLLLLSVGVIFLKNKYTNAINFIVMIVFFFQYVLLIERKEIVLKNTNRKITLFLILLIVHICFLFVFRGENDRLTFSFFWFLVLICTIYLERSILERAMVILANIIIVIIILALINITLAFIGVELPYIEYTPDIRNNLYYIYPGSVRLHGQDFVFYNKEIFRPVGIFAEPSIFGIISALIYHSKIFIDSKWKKNILILGVLISISLGAYAILIVFFIKKFKAKQFVFLFLIGLIALSLNIEMFQEALDRFFFNKLTDNILSDRVSGDFSLFLDEYINNISFLQFFLGDGTNVLANNNFIVSDYRGFLLKYGLLGVLINIGFLFSILKNSLFINKKNVILIFIIIFAHRSWLLNSFYIMFFLFYISGRDKQIQTNK